jgi:hypothetical protein
MWGKNIAKSECRLAGVIINLNALNCFKFELQFKFRNIFYSYIIANFLTYLRTLKSTLT